MNTQRTLLLLAAVSMSALSVGCSTPKPALDFAAQGAVVVDKAQSETSAFIDRATQSYKRREEIVQELAKGEIADTSQTAFNAWLANEAGFTSDQERSDLIKKIAEQSRSSRQQRQDDLEKKRAEIAANFGDAVKAPDKSLASAKKAFLALAQELSTSEWLEFSWAYARQLQDDLKKLDGQAGKAPGTP